MRNKTFIKRIENAHQALHNVQRTIYNIMSDYEGKDYCPEDVMDGLGCSGIDIDDAMSSLKLAIFSSKTVL